MKLLSILTDFLFPKQEKVLALEALSTNKLLDILPQAERVASQEVVAIFDYRNKLVKELIWQVKYVGNRTLADKLGEVLYDVIESELFEKNILEKFNQVILIPMPISDKRRFERGWNQTELITNAIKKRDLGHHFKYLPRELIKIRHTESQTKTANKSERTKNLNQTMEVLNPKSIESEFVVLVDDVVTTGSTFAEATRALKEAGAKKILSVAIAH